MNGLEDMQNFAAPIITESTMPFFVERVSGRESYYNVQNCQPNVS